MSEAADSVMTGFPDHFYGFPEVPFHVYLGMRFERPSPSADAVVVMPAAPRLLCPDGSQSPAAVYTVGEIASGVALCDALALHGVVADPSRVPLVLTKRATFSCASPVRGELNSRARLAPGGTEAVQRLRTSRKASASVECAVLGEDERLAGTVRVEFYIRMMKIGQLEELGGRMMPGMAERARELLGARAEHS